MHAISVTCSFYELAFQFLFHFNSYGFYFKETFQDKNTFGFVL